MENFWLFFLRKRQFSILVLCALILLGTISLISIPKESSPEIQIPIGIVTTILPGASAEDIEKLVTNKIEDAVANVERLDTLTSTSREGISSVVVTFDADADIEASIAKLKDRVDTVIGELPSDAETPRVSDVNFADQPILFISITSDRNKAELTHIATTLKDDLQALSGVARVGVSGVPPRQTTVVLYKESIASLGISAGDVVLALARSNLALPVGSITTDNIIYNINFESDIRTTQEIENIPIATRNGRVIFIRDIAFVSDGIAKDTSISRLSIDASPSTQSMTLSIFKTRGANILAVTKRVENELEQKKSDVLIGARVLTTFSSADFIKEDLTNLSSTGLQTVLLVMLLLVVALGWREAIIAGLSIPLSFLISFIGLSSSGNTINFVSLFSLILAVGILVDSAIVITEAIHTKITANTKPSVAARETIREFGWPLISGTATTIAVFVPLFFLSGITGRFIAMIPFTVIFVLTASLFVALAFTPLIASLYLNKSQAVTKLSRLQEYYTHRIQNAYRTTLTRILQNRKWQNRFMAGIVLASLLSFILPAIGLVHVIFFPGGDQDFLYTEIEMPEGTTLEITDLAARSVEEILYDIPDIASFVTTIGSGSAFNESAGTGSKFANMTINLRKDREHTSSEIISILRERTRGLHAGIISVSEPKNGPPVGTPIEITFLGDDSAELERVVSQTERIAEQIEGTTNVTTSTKNDGSEFVLHLNKARATQLGISEREIAQTIRAALNGITATSIREGDSDVDVVVLINLNTSKNADIVNTHANTTIDALRGLSIATPNGSVLVGSLVDITLKRGNAVIRHEDRKRIGTVGSDVRAGYNVRVLTQEIQKRINEEVDLGTSVAIKVGGENKEVNKSFREMGYSLIFGVILMLAILVLQFNSFRYTFFILSVIPFTLIGIFIGLAISGQPLSFPSMLGFIALSGIVVNNSIILIDAINKLRAENTRKPLLEAIVEGSVSRLRPITLTTITTVVGIAPLTYASELWGPLAFSVMFGLSFAVLLTLALVPILYMRFPGPLHSIVQHNEEWAQSYSEPTQESNLLNI